MRAIINIFSTDMLRLQRITCILFLSTDMLRLQRITYILFLSTTDMLRLQRMELDGSALEAQHVGCKSSFHFSKLAL